MIPFPRPHGWAPPEEGEITDSETESEAKASSSEVETSESEEDSRDKGKAKWLSGAWPMKTFDETLPVSQRKAEWVRFRDQYERITSCKVKVSPETLLTGLKIHAGSYLLSIIEMQENMLPSTKNIYKKTIKALNKYFEQTCDKNQERIKLREMKMKSSESFADWVLRLEAQAKFCDFEVVQKNEEIMQALLRRSIPEISGKLYEMSGLFKNKLSKVIKQGHHLDHVRSETTAATEQQKDDKSIVEASMSGTAMKEEENRIMYVDQPSARYKPYKQKQGRSFLMEPRNNWAPRNAGYKNHKINCTSCGREHALKNCPAFRAKCYKCDRTGHFASVCRSGNLENASEHATSKKAFKKEAKQIHQVTEKSDSDEY